MKKVIVYLSILTVLLFVIGWYFSTISFYVIFSIIISAVLRPVTNRISSIHLIGRHVPRWFAILVSFVAVVSIFAIIGSLFIPLISAQLQVIATYDLDFLYEQIQYPAGKFEDFLLRYKLIRSEPGFLIKQVRENLISNFNILNIQGLVNRVINTTSSILVGTMAITFITFFLLLENGILRRNIINLVPNSYFELYVSTFNKVEKLLSNYLIGLLIQMTAIFTIASIGLTILGIEYALTIAFFAAVANLIPYAGPLLGATFGVVVGLTTSSYGDSGEISFFILKILSVFSVVQLSDNIILQPLIFSKSVKAHPLEIFVVIFAGAKIAGIPGMIFAIPVYTVFRVSIMEFYKGYKAYKIFKI